MGGLKERMAAGDRLAGTFVKTPAPEVIEVLAMAGLDFLCLDAEHAPFDRRGLDLSLGIGRALGVPMLVRVPVGAPEVVLGALDMGATGIVVPHVRSVAQAETIARSARFGPGGRGYAGSTRWANYGAGTMPANLARSAAETVVIAQIEDLDALEAVEEIAAVPGIDAVFAGPADLTVALGQTDMGAAEVQAALARVAAAATAAGKPAVVWVPDAGRAADWAALGFGMFFVASDHAWMLAGARAAAAALR